MSLTQTQPPAKTRLAPRLVIPFVNTEPLTDVRLALLLLPLWWVMGVEQFIWPIIFGIAAVKVLYFQRLRLIAGSSLRWFALFIVAVIISGFFVNETFRLLTYARNLGAFVAGFLALLVISNRARTWKSIDKVLDAVLILMFLAGLAGLLGMMNIWRPAIQSVIGQLLPASVTSTNYGQTIAIREWGDFSWFAGLGLYFRVSSFFLFSNHYSSALIYVIPFFFMKMGQTRGLGKVLIALAIVMLALNLIYTTGRVATLSLLAGALYYAMFHSTHRRPLRALISLGLTLALVLILFSATLELTSGFKQGGVISQTAEAVDAFTYARGEGSFINRFGVYGATLQGFLQRPLFGWGTERDVEGLNIPAGSHSEYLAALYRQGLLGLIALAGLLISAWRATRPPRGQAAGEPMGVFLRYGRWFFVAALINSIMTDPSVDSTTYVILWSLIALLIAAGRLVRTQGEYAPSTD